MKTRILCVVGLTLATCFVAGAQDVSDVANKVATDAAATTQTDSHGKAVERFLSVMKMEETTKQTIDQMLAMQIQQNPQMAEFSDVMKTFLQKHLSFDAIKGDMIKLYKDNFTEAEIDQLTDFYQTPVGKKAAEKLPMLAAAGAQIGGQRVQANMAELQAAMAKRQAELQSELEGKTEEAAE